MKNNPIFIKIGGKTAFKPKLINEFCSLPSTKQSCPTEITLLPLRDLSHLGKQHEFGYLIPSLSFRFHSIFFV